MLQGVNQGICEWLELYGSAGIFLWCLLAAVLGGCFGSFTTMCVWRIPRGLSTVWPPSQCPKCGHTLGPGENIPIFGWILLGGKCKGCKMPISPRYVLIELTATILFTITAYQSAIRGIPLAVLPAWTLIVISIGSACTDCELRIIPDEFTYTGMAIALLSGYFLPFAFPPFPKDTPALDSLIAVGFQIAAAGTFAYCARLAGKLLFKREALGLGDVKFMMATAGLAGLTGMIFSAFSGSFLALLWIGFDAWKRGKLRKKFAYGPFLAIGAVLWLLIRNFVFRN